MIRIIKNIIVLVLFVLVCAIGYKYRKTIRTKTEPYYKRFIAWLKEAK